MGGQGRRWCFLSGFKMKMGGKQELRCKRQRRGARLSCSLRDPRRQDWACELNICPVNGTDRGADGNWGL